MFPLVVISKWENLIEADFSMANNKKKEARVSKAGGSGGPVHCGTWRQGGDTKVYGGPSNRTSDFQLKTRNNL